LRISILLSGVVIIGIGMLYLVYALSDPTAPFLDSQYSPTALFTIAMGVANVYFGVATAKGGGVTIASNSQDPIRMVVDRGVIGSTVYVLAFSSTKLVLKRLTSGSVTVLSVIVFALAGLFIAFLIGAAVGGITAFSLQEFLTQKRRNAVQKTNLLEASGKGDMEFVYNDLERVQLTRARLRLHLKDGILGIVISRRYPGKMLPVLEKIVPSSKLAEAT
jgi:hypothetical protein